MTLLRFYFRALFRSPLYLIALAVAVWSLSAPRPQVVILTPEAKGVFSIAFLFVAGLLTFLFHPRKVLQTDPFWLELPTVRERLALILWLGLALPLLTAFYTLYGFSVFWGFHAVALLELSLLATGSVLAWGLTPLPLAAWGAACTADRWPLVFLLGAPYLTAAAIWLGRRLPTRHWRGFRYAPGMALPVVLLLIGFDLYQRRLHSPMRFIIGKFIGLHRPDFDQPLLVLFFLSAGILYLLLPFLNIFALRQVDASLAAVRAVTGTPWTRRLQALTLALALNLPVGLLLSALDFVVIAPERLWSLIFAAAGFNVLFLTESEHSTWSGYALVGYLFWAHLAPADGHWLVPDILLGLTALLAYDLDIWLPHILRAIRRPGAPSFGMNAHPFHKRLLLLWSAFKRQKWLFCIPPLLTLPFAAIGMSLFWRMFLSALLLPLALFLHELLHLLFIPPDIPVRVIVRNGILEVDFQGSLSAGRNLLVALAPHLVLWGAALALWQRDFLLALPFVLSGLSLPVDLLAWYQRSVING